MATDLLSPEVLARLSQNDCPTILCRVLALCNRQTPHSNFALPMEFELS